MASRRGTFKPAPRIGRDEPGQKRKTLAQGRLFSAPAMQPQVSGQGAVPAKPTQVSIVPTCLPTGPVHLDEGTVTPRKHPPQATHSSPEQNRTSQNLDLSDSEIDFPNLPQRRDEGRRKETVDVTQQDGVMLIETVPIPDIDGTSTVGIKYNYEKSPGRVIRHSPSAIKSGLGASADGGGDRWHVGVDRVPRVRVKDPDADADDTLVEDPSDSQQPLISPLVIREKPRERAPPRKSPSPKRSSKPRSGYPQPDLEDSIMTRPRMEAGALSDATDQTMASDSDVCSLLEYVPAAAKARTEAKTAGQAPKSAKKKKKERVVPSRYMEAMASKTAKGSNSTHEKSSMLGRPGTAKKNLSGKRTSSAPRKDKTSSGGRHLGPGEPQTLVERSRTFSGGRQAPSKQVADKVETPRDQGIPGVKSSTPTQDSLSILPQDIDASAIRGELSLLSAVSDTSHFIRSMMDQSQFLEADEGEEVDQEILDVLYARYNQWLFLNASAKKSIKEQEKLAMGQMTYLWEEVEKLRQREAELKQDLARLQHRNLLDDQLDLQQSGLGPATVNLDKLARQHSTLAAGLDTTRHQLETKEVYIPSDQDQYINALENALQESEQLLGEVSRMTRHQAPTLASFSSMLQDLDRAVVTECQELSRCQELLAATQSLAIHETSLRLQDVENASAIARQ